MIAEITANPTIYGIRAWSIPNPAPMMYRSHVFINVIKSVSESPKAVANPAVLVAMSASIKVIIS